MESQDRECDDFDGNYEGSEDTDEEWECHSDVEAESVEEVSLASRGSNDVDDAVELGLSVESKFDKQKSLRIAIGEIYGRAHNHAGPSRWKGKNGTIAKI